MATSLKLQLKKLMMMMAAITVMSIFFYGGVLAVSETTVSPSVYDILPKYGLPSGLLPSIVESYTLDEEDGKFEVELSNTCYIKFDYLVYYEKQITGVLKYGSITHLKGIQVQKLFLWFDVDEIKVDLPPSSSIYFQVGLITKKLSVDQFQSVHSCSKNLAFQLLPAVAVDDIPMLLTE